METLNELIKWIKKETEWNPDKRMIDSVKLIDEFVRPRLRAEQERMRERMKELEKKSL